mmetsp:Transcript_13702/g.26521  ORF Transcript_13702/g.26521 Transcript_13702/m.26521 type:complete len:205 (-) Transcript_13702:358-972(-)
MLSSSSPSRAVFKPKTSTFKIGAAYPVLPRFCWAPCFSSTLASVSLLPRSFSTNGLKTLAIMSSGRLMSGSSPSKSSARLCQPIDPASAPRPLTMPLFVVMRVWNSLPPVLLHLPPPSPLLILVVLLRQFHQFQQTVITIATTVIYRQRTGLASCALSKAPRFWHLMSAPRRFASTLVCRVKHRFAHLAPLRTLKQILHPLVAS